MLDTKQLKKGKGTGVINKKDSWGFALRVSGYRLRVKKNRSLFTENANVGISGKKKLGQRLFIRLNGINDNFFKSLIYERHTII
jgi:hypothetical protein